MHLLQKFKNYFFSFVLLVLLFSPRFTFCPQLIRGDIKDKNENEKSFSFAIGPYIFCPRTGNFYIAAADAIYNKFSVSYAGRQDTQFKELTQFNVMIDGVLQKSPLRYSTSRTTHLALLSDKLVMVNERYPGIIFVEDGAGKWQSTIKERIVDHEGNPLKITALATDDKEFIFAAVTNYENHNPFNGMFILQFKKETKKVDKGQSDDSTKQENEEKNENERKTKFLENTINKKNKKVKNGSVGEIYGLSEAIKINGELTGFNGIEVMHFDNKLKRLYVGMQAVSGANLHNGARSIAVGRLVPTSSNKVVKKSKHKNDKNRKNKKGRLQYDLIFEPIISDDAVTTEMQIVATRGAFSALFVHKLATMHTSTLLDYLIIVGDNGLPETTGDKVYALPLVNHISEIEQKLVSEKLPFDKQHGLLASSQSLPKNYFSKQNIFLNRAFIDVATKNSPAPISNNISALVGADQLPLSQGQKLTQLVVAGDAVFASIGNGYDQQATPGIFHSQAIFDDYGRIAAWTKWQRVAGNDEPVFGMAYDEQTKAFWYITGKDFSSAQAVKRTVLCSSFKSEDKSSSKKSEYKQKENALITLLKKEFPKQIGGIQALHDFPFNTISFSNRDQLSLLVATGQKKVALIETAQEVDGALCPNKCDFSSFMCLFTNGAVESALPNGTKAIIFSGGELNDLGSVECTQFASDMDNGWLFAGGASGICVLCNEDGSGWKNGLQKGFGGIAPGMRFVKIGDYKFVKKLISDEIYLYVLTEKSFERINLKTSNFSANALKIDKTVLASIDQNIFNKTYVSFSDAVVSSRFALLASSMGLFRVGNSRDVCRDDQSGLNWQRVSTQSNISAVVKLLTVSTTGLERDFAKNGQVYVLSSYVGSHESQLHRFYVNDVGEEINDKTMLALSDSAIKDGSNFFIAIDSYFNNFFLDGASILSAAPYYSKENPVVLRHSLHRSLTNKDSFLYIASKEVNKNNNGTRVKTIIRNSGSGALLIATDNGLYIYE